MIIEQFSKLSLRKQQLNKLCDSAVAQQICCDKAGNNHLRNRRRYLAKQIQKRLPLNKFNSTRHWLHALTLVFALWGFHDLLAPDQAMAAAKFANDTNTLTGVAVGTGNNTAPSFVDIDGDGDFDAFIGDVYGTVKYYRNTEIDAGANVGFVADALGNPLSGVGMMSPGQNAIVSFADIDKDGDFDAYIGEDSGAVKFYINSGLPMAPSFARDLDNPLQSVTSLVGFAAPTFADIDGDGDLDGFVGELFGTVKYYRNNEFPGPDTGIFDTELISMVNPFGVFDVGSNAVPRFVDIDNDGDLDAFVGGSSGVVEFYRNTEIDAGANVGFVADMSNPLGLIDVGLNAAPDFVDIDGDGDLDAFIGESTGSIKFYVNSGTTKSPFFGIVTNPLNGVAVGANTVPGFADIDGDGDLDAFVGASDGTVKYLRNTEIDAGPNIGFVADAGGNPLSGVMGSLYAAPAFADIDGDGDLDAVVGVNDGTVKYYRNTEIDTVAQGTGFVADAGGNPLAVVADGYYATLAFVDIDGDGDLDAFVGVDDGSVNYYRNTEIDAGPNMGFVPDVGGNPLTAVAVSSRAMPAIADVDGDGDLDAFISAGDGTVSFYRNNGTNMVPMFVADAAGNPLAGFDVGMNAALVLADVDGDGDPDAFIGESGGSVKFYQNSDPVPVPVDIALGAAVGIPATTSNVKTNDGFKVEVPGNNFNVTAFDAMTANTGTVSNNGDGTFTYTQTGGYIGIDTFTYTIIDGVGNTAVGTVTVNVSAAPPVPVVDSFSALATTIDEGNSTTLSWMTTDANSVAISAGVGAGLAADGNIVVSPTVTTTYTLTATGAGGVVMSGGVTVNVNPAPAPAPAPAGGGGGGGSPSPWIAILSLPLLLLLRRFRK